MTNPLDPPIEATLVVAANVPPPADEGGGVDVRHFKITNGSDFADYILARTCNGAGFNVGEVDIPIAKAREFRRTPAVGGSDGQTIDGVAYVFDVSHTERTGTRASDGKTETQIPKPGYKTHNFIKATKTVSETGVSTETADPEDSVPIVWEEIVPRQWAKKFES